MPEMSRLRRPLIVLAGLLLAAYALWALLWAVADVAHFRAQGWVEAWGNLSQQAAKAGYGYRPLEADWQEARADAETALRLSLGSPDYRDTLGQIYESREMDLLPGDPAARDNRLKALALYRESARQRPAWPYTQAAIALTKYRLNEPDAEFDAALRKTMQLGPWEPDLMILVADVGSELMVRLSPASRQLVLDTIVRSASRPRNKAGKVNDPVWEHIQSRHREAQICGWMVRGTPWYADHCDPGQWWPVQEQGGGPAGPATAKSGA